jgi:GH15 family glucan-1,4-alpha-glucosidase
VTCCWWGRGGTARPGRRRTGGRRAAVQADTDLNPGFEGPRAIARRRLRAGEQVFCALSWQDGTPPETFAAARQRLSGTADFWHEWLGRGKFPDHPWRKYLQRSALTLKGLIYAPTGALLAAATSSLPETPGGERNFDYRFTWLRDATFMLWGLYTLGLDREADDFFYFITDLLEQDADLQIMYGIGGERELTEQTLDHLSGYDGAGRSASATAPGTSASTTCGACCSIRSTCTPVPATG